MHVMLFWKSLGYTHPIDGDDLSLKLRSESWYTVDGQTPTSSVRDYLAGIYRIKDDSFVRLHTNFPQSVYIKYRRFFLANDN